MKTNLHFILPLLSYATIRCWLSIWPPFRKALLPMTLYGDKSVFDLAPQLCFLADVSTDLFPSGLNTSAAKALDDLIDRTPDWPATLMDDLPRPRDPFKRLVASKLRDNPKVPVAPPVPPRPAVVVSSTNPGTPYHLNEEKGGLFQPPSSFSLLAPGRPKSSQTLPGGPGAIPQVTLRTPGSSKPPLRPRGITGTYPGAPPSGVPSWPAIQ